MNGTPKSARETRLEREVEQLRAALNVALAYATGLLKDDEPGRAEELTGATATLLATGEIGRNFERLKGDYRSVDGPA